MTLKHLTQTNSLTKIQPSFTSRTIQKGDIYIRRSWRQVQYMVGLF